MLCLLLFLGFLAMVTALKPSVNITYTVIPNAYMIQLKNETAISASSISGRGLDPHSMFHKRAEGIDYDVRTEFTNPKLFYGLSITVTEDLTSEEVEAKVLDIPDV